MRFLQKFLPDEKVLRINYQSLAQHPAQTLALICNFVGVPYDSSVVEEASTQYVFRRTHHLIGGNRLTASPPNTQIQYDPSWENRLRLSDRLCFFVLGGHLVNQRLGIHSDEAI